MYGRTLFLLACLAFSIFAVPLPTSDLLQKPVMKRDEFPINVAPFNTLKRTSIVEVLPVKARLVLPEDSSAGLSEEDSGLDIATDVESTTNNKRGRVGGGGSTNYKRGRVGGKGSTNNKRGRIGGGGSTNNKRIVEE